MEEILLNESFEVSAGDFLSAGEASGRIKKILKQLGVQSEVIRRAAIVSYEAELNLVIHSLGGRLELEVTPQFVNHQHKGYRTRNRRYFPRPQGRLVHRSRQRARNGLWSRHGPAQYEAQLR